MQACYQAFQSGNFQRNAPLLGNLWQSKMANNVGHGLIALVEQDEKTLVDGGLISPRIYNGGVMETDGRLTDLGIKFCKNIEEYKVATER